MFHSLGDNLCVHGDFNIDLFKYDGENNAKYIIYHFFVHVFISINKQTDTLKMNVILLLIIYIQMS